MSKYIVKVYIATDWSFLTQADHYAEYLLESAESLPNFAKRLAIFGFQHPTDGKRWIMPGAILEVRIATKALGKRRNQPRAAA